VAAVVTCQYEFYTEILDAKAEKNLITIISVLLISGFVLTSLTSYFISVASLKNLVVKNELPLTSDNIYSEIQRDLLRPIFISSLMASDTFLRDWVIKGENNPEEITRYLREIKEEYAAITVFFVSDKSHHYYHISGLLKTVKQTEPRDVWYFRVRELDTKYEINVDIDMANNDAMTVFVNYRVFDYQGKFLGATGVGLTVDAVQKLISRYQDHYARDILFIDDNGEIKLSSIGDNKKQPHLKALRQISNNSELMSKINSTETDSFETTLAGQSVLFNTRYIKEFDWNLLVVKSKVEGTSELFQTLMINLAACALISIFILSITHYTISSYQKNIEQMDTTDKLTGLHNRQALDILFNQVLRDQTRHPFDLSVLLFDLDHFKGVNDKSGHLAGDAVLKQISQLAKSRLREADIICRWGWR